MAHTVKRLNLMPDFLELRDCEFSCCTNTETIVSAVMMKIVLMSMMLVDVLVTSARMFFFKLYF